MKKLETVLAQLSDLYEFNRKLKLYKLQKQDSGERPEPSQSDCEDQAPVSNQENAPS